MYSLRDLIELWKKKGIWLQGDPDIQFSALSCDSRQISKSKKWVFFARKGYLHDGHQFVPELLLRDEVVALVVERVPEKVSAFSEKLIQVRDSRLAMALAAKYFYGDPSRELLCVAVTGTNGKTTTSFLLKHLFDAFHKPAAISGTIKTGYLNSWKDLQLTTLDFSVLQNFLKEVKDQSAKSFVFEASSHALDQRRLLGLELDAALFTNLSPEHLDYHQNMDTYFQAKKILFTEHLRESIKDRKIAVLPDDGTYGSRLLEELQSFSELELVSWGYHPAKLEKHLQILSWSSNLDAQEIEFLWKSKKLRLKSSLVGKFNIENLAGVLALGLSLSLDEEALIKALESFPGVPGRLERVPNSKGFKVFVDYAHTPDALENILSTLRPLCHGKLKVVFGCGGDRDRSKRPVMAQTVELYADELFITSDNPRSEAPEKIIEEILLGLQRVKSFRVEADRRKAIEMALKNLEPQDVVVIAGKGHEKYQQIGDKRLEFDDVQVAREMLG